jgi:hypothetical protein
MKYLTQSHSAVLLKGYISALSQVAHFILILKPGTPPNNLTSYLPVSLLPMHLKFLKKIPPKSAPEND